LKKFPIYFIYLKMENEVEIVSRREQPGVRGKLNFCLEWLKARDLSEKKVLAPQ
jgi:hypothetical protein